MVVKVIRPAEDFIDIIENMLGLSSGFKRKCDHRCYRSTNNSENRTKKTTVKENTYTDEPKLSDYIDHVLATGTATVVFWKDGTKTSVKCSKEEEYDYEKGLAMATLKHIFGNKYYENMKDLIATYPYTEAVKKVKKSKKPTKSTADTKTDSTKSVKKATKSTAKKSVDTDEKTE